MSAHRLVLVGAIALVLAAAGGGVYLASRNADAPASPAQMQTSNVSSEVKPTAVQETEATVAQPAEVKVQTEAVSSTPKANTERSQRSVSSAQTPTEKTSRRPAVAEDRSARRRDSQDSGTPDRSWTVSRSEPTQVNPPPPVEPVVPAVVLPPPPIEPVKTYEELVISADSVIGVSLETSLTSETAQLEDPVDGRITRDVRVGNRVAIPAGTRVRGSVTLVERGGKVKERARLGIRFHTVALADGTRLPLQTETIYREGESPASESTAKIGGAAAGGAILGAILGGKKGAAIGGAIGGAGGTAAVMAGGRNAATLPSGTTVTVRVLSPTTVTVERDNDIK